jgi:hypothetical protein
MDTHSLIFEYVAWILNDLTALFLFILFIRWTFRVVGALLKSDKPATARRYTNVWQALIEDLRESWRLDRTLYIVILLSIVGAVISVVLLTMGQAVLGAASSVLAFAVVAGKTILTGIIGAASGYYTEQFLKRREKKASSTPTRQDD